MKQDLYDYIVAYIVENQNKFYRLAYSYVRNREDALDVVQNAVCKALENYGGIRNEGAISTWFYRILVNESLLFIKERKRMTLGETDQEEAHYEEKGFEIQDDLYDSINRLDGDTQTIIKLRFFEELSLKEIAQIMEMNLNTVKARLYRGLRQLKVNIQEVDV
ncbi:MAG TPA: sigma-70 family RNA polymerase sigma factor [Candidatus Enterocloster excrementipullorum]|uniref:Sigma-70 family RNA polymerase sigma factor n=1 Tax=Candidatus Enterocloster excrementipullorum TaxID=2838559 RepID=A0A9D2SGN2_9FIRM|nr:sigma-70 family RNA polymerase sigma factor [Candidatus Enterocloster excrementipullorum]